MNPEKFGIRPVWAEIDLDKLAHNMRETRRITPEDAMIMAAVKADGYGHGAIQCAATFLENGADRLATATLGEAIQIRKNGIKAPILCLGYIPEYLTGEALRYKVGLTVYRYEQGAALSQLAQKEGEEALVHFKLDTGMGRLGFQVGTETIEDIIRITKMPGLNVEGIFTHFAVSDEADKTYTHEQFRKFKETVDDLEKKGVNIPIKHVSNSAAIIDLPEYSLDMVRPGIMLYGFYPSEHVDHSRVDLRPVMTLKAKISHIKTTPPGTGLSYGLTYTTTRKSRIATLPIGYADGYNRKLSNLGQVAIRGKRAPIVGRVCMDQCIIDVTDIPEVNVGEEVTLFGDGSENSPHAEEMAKWLDTITHEITCSVSRRIPRVYLKKGEVVEVKDYLNPIDRVEI